MWLFVFDFTTLFYSIIYNLRVLLVISFHLRTYYLSSSNTYKYFIISLILTTILVLVISETSRKFNVNFLPDISDN